MNKQDIRVDNYIANAPEFAKPILTHLRSLIHEACPEIEESWKWSFPNFIYKGAIICHFAAFKKHCAFGFWKAALMNDDDTILKTKDRDSMGNLGKIESLNDLPDDAQLIKYIQAAVKLNDEGIKMPPKNKVSDKEKKELIIPEFLSNELLKNDKANEIFTGFSYSCKKEYIEWLTEAKTETTRTKRLQQAIEMIAEGKGRHWKYAMK